MRSIKLIVAFARYCLIRDMEFSKNFIITILIHTVYISLNLAFFSLIWLEVGGFGGLSTYQMLFFLGTFILGDSLFMLFTYNGILSVPELIRKGDLDYILTKPVPSQFMATFSKVDFFSLTDFIVGTGILIYSSYKLKLKFSFYTLMFFLVLVVVGKVITYTLACLMVSLSFIFIKMQAIFAVFDEIAQLQRYPMGIYTPYRMVFSIIFPAIIVANYPAYFVFGKLSIVELAWLFIAGILLLYGCHRFWQYGLKKYQSASS